MFCMSVWYDSGIGWCDLERYRMMWIVAGNEMGNLNLLRFDFEFHCGSADRLSSA